MTPISDLSTTITAVKTDGKSRMTCCPGHDDSTPSLSVGLGKKGGVVLFCQAGCATPDILTAVGLTSAELAPPKGQAPTIAATYDYTDEHGALLFQVVRYMPKGFKQRRPDGVGGWIWKVDKEVRRTLFGLPTLAGQATVYIPEGERDVLALRSLGLTATCNSGGAGKWRDDYAQQLVAAGCQAVVVIPDNDDAGTKHAARVAASCRTAGLTVTVVTLPDVPEHGDISDWLAAGHTIDDLQALVTATPTDDADDAAVADVAIESGPARVSQATRLVDLALDAGVETWHDPNGDPYITLRVAGHREHHRLSSRHVRDWLARLHYEERQAAVGSQAVADALAVLAGQAKYDGPTHMPAVRVAGDKLRVYLDLAEPAWRAVEVDATGWRIVDDPPVKFIRSRGTQTLQAPVSGGSLNSLSEIVSLDADASRLLTGWLLGALRPVGPYPVLALAGEQGAGKTTVSRVARRLIDPHSADQRAEPKRIDDLMIAAARSRILAIDNVSHIEPWLSDALCRLSTGGAMTKRMLYSDDDEVVIEAMRPVIITAVNDVVTRGDLLDRAMTLTLPAIPESARRSEADLWQAFETIAPGVLGALLDGVSSALAREQTTVLDALPRMADWAIWVTAAEPGLGWSGTTILDSYRTMRETAVETVLDGDPLATAIRRLPRRWEGTAAELLARLAPAGRAPRGWPDSPRGMSAALRRLAPGLRGLGIDFTTRREANTGRRLITLEDAPGEPSRSSPTSPKPDPRLATGDDGSDDVQAASSPIPAHVYGPGDGRDGRDASSAVLSERTDDGVF